MVAGGGFEPPTFGLCDLTHLSMRVGPYPRGVLAIQSLRLPPPFRGLGSVLPLIHAAITAAASRVAPDPLCLHAVATTPAGPMELIRS